jgi:hypothetical protein
MLQTFSFVHLIVNGEAIKAVGEQSLEREGAWVPE